METQGGKSVVEHQTGRLRAVYFAPVLWFADHYSEARGSVVEVYVAQVGAAHGCQGLALVDGEEDVSFGDGVAFVPLRFLFYRDGARE